MERVPRDRASNPGRARSRGLTVFGKGVSSGTGAVEAVALALSSLTALDNADGTYTFTATSNATLVGASFGIDWTEGTSAAPPASYGGDAAQSVAGAAASQSITITAATEGWTAAGWFAIRFYYNLDPLDLDPADRVYSYVTAAYFLANTAPTGTPTEDEVLTAAWSNMVFGPTGMAAVYNWQSGVTGGPYFDLSDTTIDYTLTAGEVGEFVIVQQKALAADSFVDSAQTAVIAALATGFDGFLLGQA